MRTARGNDAEPTGQRMRHAIARMVPPQTDPENFPAPSACRLDRPRLAGFAEPPYPRVTLTGRRQRPSCVRPEWVHQSVKTSNGEHFREQAHFPAEQPASQPHPWVPPAHAHPRRARDHLVAPSPRSRSPRRLNRAGRAVRCCPRPRGFEPPTSSAPRCAAASVPVVPRWCCTCCEPITRRPGRVSSCPRPSATPSGGTG